jgi:ribosome biogenesis protein ERB1
MLDNLRKGKSAKPLSFEYFEHDNFDSNNLLSSYMPKRRFIASKWERIKINKLVQGIKLGRIKLYEEPKDIE